MGEQKQQVLRGQEKGLRLEEPVLRREVADLGAMGNDAGRFVQDALHSVDAREPSVAVRRHQYQGLVESFAVPSSEDRDLRQSAHGRRQSHEDPCDEGQALDNEDRVVVLIASILRGQHEDPSRLSRVLAHVAQARFTESHVVSKSAEDIAPAAEVRSREEEERSKKTQSR